MKKDEDGEYGLIKTLYSIIEIDLSPSGPFKYNSWSFMWAIDTVQVLHHLK